MGKKHGKERENKALRVALYCRVATDTGEGWNLAMQKEKLRRFAEQQGYTVVAEVVDHGSGLSFDRPGIQEILRLSHRHIIDAVLAENICRIGRDMQTALRIEGKLKKQHVIIKTLQQEESVLPYMRKIQHVLGHLSV